MTDNRSRSFGQNGKRIETKRQNLRGDHLKNCLYCAHSDVIYVGNRINYETEIWCHRTDHSAKWTVFIPKPIFCSRYEQRSKDLICWEKIEGSL